MSVPLTDSVTLTVPRTVLVDIAQLTSELTDRMHQLLERNTDGQLNAIERSELEALVHIAEFGQIAQSALHPPGNP